MGIKIKHTISLIMFWAASTQLPAQNIREQYEAYRQQTIQEYEDFRSKANAEYAEFVKQAWKQYQMLPAIPRPKEEEVPPVVMPKGNEDKPLEDKKQEVVEVVPVVEPTPQPLPLAPIREQPTPEEHYFAFTFFGTKGKVRLDETMRFQLPNVSEEAIANGWNTLSDRKYDNLIRDCLELRIRHSLCDWAYLRMLYSLANSFYAEGSNEATLLMSYLYCQSGYKMRLAQTKGQLRLLFSSKHGIYESSYFEVEGEKFYPLGSVAGDVFICGAAFPKEQSLSLLIPQAPQFVWKETKKRVLQSERYTNMRFETSCNRNTIDFYNTYPTSELNGNFMTRWAMYANTPFEKKIQDALYPSLRSHVNGVSQKEAVERLLNWVQTAFVYEYDDKVWGGDRAFFPVETLYYPYADCEDRSILFTRLVRDLLDLKCVLIYYPGHLAAAVCFTSNVTGDYILLDGKKYVICDPTYIGAPVGATMPGMDNTKADVILLE